MSDTPPAPPVDARVLAVIPARGGSRGLPGKNTRSFALKCTKSP